MHQPSTGHLAEHHPLVLMTQISKAAKDSLAFKCRTSLTELVSAVLAVCKLPPGHSKQHGVTFDRSGTHGGIQDDSVVRIRKALRELLKHASSVFDNKQNQRGDFLASVTSSIESTTVQTLLNDDAGFFQNDTFAKDQLEVIAASQDCYKTCTFLMHILVTPDYDAKPMCEEATRRLYTFASSLNMDLPNPVKVANSKSLSTLTPFYDETVLYSQEDMTKSEGNISMSFYLQKMHADEWQNCKERLGMLNLDEEQIWETPARATEIRLWASCRGQTLARCVHGVMQYEAALQLFATQELDRNSGVAPHSAQLWVTETEPQRLAHQKYGYVVSCQIYGKYKETNKVKQRDIDFLMQLYPNLRVAYVDSPSNGEPNSESVLLRWDPQQEKVVEVYRVKLPGSFFVGEGKPENQNHAIIFTRGEYLQTRKYSLHM
jgi:callose synthase